MGPRAKAALRGSAAYDAYMISVFGRDRWLGGLRAAMESPRRSCALILNSDFESLIASWRSRGFSTPVAHEPSLSCAIPVFSPSSLKSSAGLSGGPESDVSSISCADDSDDSFGDLIVDSGDPDADSDGILAMPRPVSVSSGLRDYYPLDLASVLVARAVGARDGDTVLDLCAAPGGKSLVLASCIGPRSGRLFANDVSPSRRGRLKSVIGDYLAPAHRQRVTVLGSQGFALGATMAERFDRVLADVPCSADRHMIVRPTELESWTTKRPRQMAKRQAGLLSGGLHALRPGGTLVYATCALSPEENDSVVKTAVERCAKKFEVRVQEPSANVPGMPPGATMPGVVVETTELGHMVLPDLSDGWGPLYWSVIHKGLPVQ
eukprot:CAMPEP_0171567206 /NCGR_PEP_ID=MMETSP0961-20121227/1025_1 /TAXON_ID=87120 /ORGANISM="Aurantiochytrium limacinum, Strain ATCCMYA-1381" /LENGTH=377 /DNA_ID=CAMNT_0012121089 /DNA_START=1 /DNA_END=1134 /DNA_ORIENTATION=+